MVESSSLCEADERHALIIGYSLGNPPLPSVRDDVKVVEAFTHRNSFNSVSVLRDSEATSNAVIGFLTEQAYKCY